MWQILPAPSAVNICLIGSGVDKEAICVSSPYVLQISTDICVFILYLILDTVQYILHIYVLARYRVGIFAECLEVHLFPVRHLLQLCASTFLKFICTSCMMVPCTAARHFFLLKCCICSNPKNTIVISLPDLQSWKFICLLPYIHYSLGNVEEESME